MPAGVNQVSVWLGRPELPPRAASAVVALLGLNLLWRVVRYSLGFPLFGDEAFVANSLLLLDFWGLTGALEHYQVVPLLFLWGEWSVVQLAGTSEWALRTLPFVAGVASVLLFARLAFRFLPAPPAVFAISVFCASYFPVRHATEVKPYAVDMLVALVLIISTWKYFEQPDRVRWSLWTAVVIIAVWASYPAVFVAAGMCAVLLLYALRRDAHLVMPVTVSGSLCTISFAAMYLTVGSAQREAGADVLINLNLWARTFPPWSEPWRFAEWFVHVHLGKMFAYPNGGNNGGSVLTFVLFCIGGWRLWLHPQRLKLLLLLSPFPLMFIAASIQAYPYGGSARVAQHVAPAICLLVGVGLAYVLRIQTSREVMSKRGLVLLAVCGLLAIGGSVRDVLKPYKELADLRNREAVWALRQTSPESERWFGYGSWGGGSGPDLYDWAGSAARVRYYFLRPGTPDITWGVAAETIIPAEGRTTTLLAYEHEKIPFPRPEFERYLNKIASILGPHRREEFAFDDGKEKLVRYRFGSGDQ